MKKRYLLQCTNHRNTPQSDIVFGQMLLQFYARSSTHSSILSSAQKLLVYCAMHYSNFTPSSSQLHIRSRLHTINSSTSLTHDFPKAATHPLRTSSNLCDHPQRTQYACDPFLARITSGASALCLPLPIIGGHIAKKTSSQPPGPADEYG